MLDCLIVGAGPAGLAAANTFQRAGLTCLALEKGAIADHIRQYPTFMQFFSTRDLLEIDGFPLTITEEKPSRRQYLAYLARFAQERELDVRRWTTVESVRARDGAGFQIGARSRNGRELSLEARTVLVACGAFENPHMLGVPGEELAKVSHQFAEPHPYVGQKVLVVGGRNSAIEIALLLWRAGADVSLSYRRSALRGHGIKYWLRPDIENRLKNDEIHGHLGTEVERIEWESATLKKENGGTYKIENDFVLCMTGYDPPVSFLRGMGVELEEDTNVPRHDPETLETNVPGLFVAGTIVAGNVSGHVFIENSRRHGEMILNGMQKYLNGGKQS